MVLDIDHSKWEAPRNRLPQRSHSTEKQAAIRSQIDSLLALGVIEESRASHWSQLHMVKKPTPGEWRMTLDFVQLNAATRGLEGWPISNIQQTLSRLGTVKPKLFGLLDFTAGYHRTPTLRHEPALQCIEAFEYCQQAISNCQELYFLEDTVTPILQTDASDYGVGGYLYSVINGKVRVIRFFSKALVGAQLKWSAREKECYGKDRHSRTYWTIGISF